MKYDVVNAIVIAIAGEGIVLRQSPPAWVGAKTSVVQVFAGFFFVRLGRSENKSRPTRCLASRSVHFSTESAPLKRATTVPIATS